TAQSKMITYLKSNKNKADHLRPYVLSMRKEFIKNMDFYVQQAIKSLKSVGARVYLAKTREEAIDIFLKEIGGEKIIVKSKSNDAKEIGLISALESKGISVVETDAGDVIIQLTGEKSQWQLGPAVHVDPELIAACIEKKFHVKVNHTEEDLLRFIRDRYRDIILNARVALTSANAIAADDGTIALIENEGNISRITRLAKKHIVVAGITKIVPTIQDAVNVCKINELLVSVTGAYISLIRGPSNTTDIRGKKVVGMYGAQDLVVILVDDWRSKIKNTFLEDFLYCINCKACHLVCTALGAVGDAFRSGIALGGYGIIKGYLHDGIEQAVRNGLYLCTNCKTCMHFCPVNVDLGKILSKMKKEARSSGLSPPKLESYLKNIIINKNPFDFKR
ncbi:MAG: LUD domain-containing protein, partial [Promethearchaeota archaeon]